MTAGSVTPSRWHRRSANPKWIWCLLKEASSCAEVAVNFSGWRQPKYGLEKDRFWPCMSGPEKSQPVTKNPSTCALDHREGVYGNTLETNVEVLCTSPRTRGKVLRGISQCEC